MVNTSTFEIISNDTLRKLLISWNDVLADYQEEEILAVKNLIDHIMPYFKKHGSFIGNFKDKRINLIFSPLIFYSYFYLVVYCYVSFHLYDVAFFLYAFDALFEIFLTVLALISL